MICENCQNEVAYDAKYCSFCGTAMIKNEEPLSGFYTSCGTKKIPLIDWHETEVKKICPKCEVKYKVCPLCGGSQKFAGTICALCGASWRDAQPYLPKREEKSNEISCPRCRSTQITANKKGFSVGKAVVGGVLLGGVGLLGGAVGSNKIKITCLKCGHSWKV